jgi:hypothetical protein
MMESLRKAEFERVRLDDRMLRSAGDRSGAQVSPWRIGYLATGYFTDTEKKKGKLETFHFQKLAMSMAVNCGMPTLTGSEASTPGPTLTRWNKTKQFYRSGHASTSTKPSWLTKERHS